MKVLLADDEAVARRGLRAMLAREPDVTIVGEAATGADVERLLVETSPDVLLLDIQMPHKTGIDVVAGLDPATLPFVIFVTAHDEHAIRAFELHALDYLVKPYREDRLREAIARVRGLLGHQKLGDARRKIGAWVAGQPGHATRIRVESDERIRFVAVRDVVWIEAQDYCVLFHLAGEKILQRGTLRQVMQTLDPKFFVRVHRSAAVNVRHVRELTVSASGGLSARLTTGADVAISRSCRADLEERLRALP
jgi:two-component system LytT family response regulator